MSASSCSVLLAMRSAAVSPEPAIHAHVERLVALEAESAAGRLKLHRRHAEVGQRAVDERNAAPIEDVFNRSIVGVHEIHAIGERRERGARLRQRVLVAIEADDARRARLEERARVAAQADRAVDEQPAALRLQLAQHFRGEHGNVAPRAGRHTPNSDSARVVVGVRLALHLGEEAIVVPDVEVVVLAEHVDIAGHRRGLAKANRNEHAALHVELAGLAEVVDAIEKAQFVAGAWTASRRASARSRATRAWDKCGRTRRSGS